MSQSLRQRLGIRRLCQLLGSKPKAKPAPEHRVYCDPELKPDRNEPAQLRRGGK